MNHFFTGLLIFLLLFSGSMFGQEEAVRKLFEEYIQELNDLPYNKDVSRVTSFFDPGYVTNQTNIGLTGKVKRTKQTLSQMASGLEGMTYGDNIELNLNIDKIHHVIQGSKSAILSATLTMELTIDKKKAEKGNFAVNFAARRSPKNGEWKFVHSDNIRIVEERNAGNCPCYFYERDGGFATKIQFPIGIEYVQFVDLFEISGKKEETRSIKINLRTYKWDSAGKVFSEEEGVRTELGYAEKPKEAILLILMKMYGDNCFGFVSK